MIVLTECSNSGGKEPRRQIPGITPLGSVAEVEGQEGRGDKEIPLNDT